MLIFKLVVQIVLRIFIGKSKNGIILSQLLRQELTIAGYLSPQVSSKSSNACSANSTVGHYYKSSLNQHQQPFSLYTVHNLVNFSFDVLYKFEI